MAAAKICTRCGTDCAGKPRVKDPKGRYLCAPCAEALNGNRAAPAPAAAPGPTLEEIGEGFQIVPDEFQIAQGRQCPGCQVVVAEGAMLCTGCGYNLQTGQKFRTDAAPPRSGPVKKCLTCGYDLAGCKAGRCPECGTLIPQGSAATRVERDREIERSVFRTEYLKPLIYTGVALAVTLGFVMVQDGATTALGYLVYLGASGVLATIAYLLLCLAYLGSDAPLHLSGMRLVAAYAVADAVGTVAHAVLPPIMFLGWAITIFTLLGVIMDLMDLDCTDALILVLVVGGLKIALGIFLLVYLTGLFA